MSSTYTTSLTLTKIGNGEQSGSWGDTTNTNWQLIEDSVAGVAQVTISGASGATLSVANGTTDQSRNAVIVVTGSASGVNAIVAPLVKKVYIISNQTTGGFALTIGATTGSTVSIANGLTTLVYCDGTNFFSGITGFTGGNLSITGTINATGTITAPIFSGNIAGGAANKLLYQTGSSATNFIDAPPSSGSATLLTYTPGSGFSWSTGSVSSLAGGTTNSIPYQSSPGTTAFLANPGSSNTFYLTYNNGLAWGTAGAVTSVTVTSQIGNSGTSTNPNIGLSGIVPVANGGTGASTLAGANIALLSNTGTQTFSGTINAQAFVAQGAGSVGDQKFTVSYNSYSSGVSPQGVQIGSSGKGIIYDGSYIALGGISGGTVLSLGASAGILISSTDNTQRPTGGPWISISDERAKENITSYTKGLSALNRLRPVNYTLKGKLGEATNHKTCTGLIAQEVLNTPLESMLKLGDDGYYTLDANEVTWALVNAVKELSAEVAALKAKVGA